MIDFDQHAQILALGGLLSLLNSSFSSRFGHCTCPSSGDQLLALDLLCYAPTHGKLLKVDPRTMQALQIFAMESHPSLMGIGAQQREGESLFALFSEKCATLQGTRLLKQWLLHPELSPDTLSSRHASVDLFMRLDPEMLKSLRKELGQVKDMGKLLLKLTEGQSTGAQSVDELRVLAQSLHGVLRLRDRLSQLVSGDIGKHRFLQNIMESVDLRLVESYNMISSVLDFEQYNNEDARMAVRFGLSDALDTMKRTYFSLPESLTQIIEQELSRIPVHLARKNGASVFAIQYLPQHGYLVKTKARLPADLQEVLPDYDLAFQDDSQTHPVFYYQCQATHRLNEEVGDLVFRIRDLEAAILGGLIQELLKHAPFMTQASDSVAEMDVLMAFAAVAAENHYAQPTLVGETENCFRIVNGRHALLEISSRWHAAGAFIPNSVSMERDEGRVHIVTGPNFSGKSVLMKQTGLILFMCHIGSFVPAESCEFSFLDAIYSRIYTPHSCLTPESTFMSEVIQVCQMRHNATPNSLILLDEFGKGTLASDGVGLFVAVIQQLTESSAIPPKVLASTHFTEVCNLRFFGESHQLRFFQMAVHLGGGKCDGPGAGSLQDFPREESSFFLYTVKEGAATDSFALKCARMASVAESTVRRAGAVMLALGDQGGSGLAPDPGVAQLEAEMMEILSRLRSPDPRANPRSNNALRYVLDGGG